MFRLFKRATKEKTQQGVRKTRESWLSRLGGVFRRSAIDAELWDELEETLMTSDVGTETTAKLMQRLRERVKSEHVEEPQSLRMLLKEEITRLTSLGSGKEATALLDGDLRARPFVILVVGVNGSGKTTTIGKLAAYFKDMGKETILAAGDTFRAAAVEQLQLWGGRVGVQVVAHQQGADPGAVAFDALQAARNRLADVLIIDTAGRLHTKFNLMEELKKIDRVLKKSDASAPHWVLLALDATTGQNGLQQARHFTKAVGVSGIILTKLDGTAKGGVVLSICDQLGIPILFIGTGEKVEDLVPFDAADFAEALVGGEPEPS